MSIHHMSMCSETSDTMRCPVCRSEKLISPTSMPGELTTESYLAKVGLQDKRDEYPDRLQRHPSIRQYRSARRPEREPQHRRHQRHTHRIRRIAAS